MVLESTLFLRLGAALVAGSLIGLERSYRGRAAGFRTHALVSLASSLLMLLTAFPSLWLKDMPAELLRADPTRMAQGIMTGIGFLGAGVIYKEGMNVRGLTTAGSIWITAALGILFGAGFYTPALFGTVLSLIVLSAFRWIEIHLPSESYSRLSVGFRREGLLTENDLRAFLGALGFAVVSINYKMETAHSSQTHNAELEYILVLKTHDAGNPARLARALLEKREVLSFQLDPTVS